MSESGFCTQCGSPRAAADNFCRRCGAPRYDESSESGGGEGAPGPADPWTITLAVLAGVLALAIGGWYGGLWSPFSRSSSDNLLAGGFSRPITTTVIVPAGQRWTDTGISVTAGQSIAISATGSIYVGAIGELSNESPNGSGMVGADRFSCSALGGPTRFPFNAAGLPCWSLIGRIGVDGSPFEVGANTRFRAPASGELYLGVNDSMFADNHGNWTAVIAGGSPAGGSMPPGVAANPASPLFPIAGLYGSTNSPNQDRNTELFRNCGPYTRVFAAGNTFEQLCNQMNMQCAYVCDWEGTRQPCGANAHDGSRVVMCQPTGAAGGIGMPPPQVTR